MTSKRQPKPRLKIKQPAKKPLNTRNPKNTDIDTILIFGYIATIKDFTTKLEELLTSKF